MERKFDKGQRLSFKNRFQLTTWIMKQIEKKLTFESYADATEAASNELFFDVPNSSIVSILKEHDIDSKVLVVRKRKTTIAASELRIAFSRRLQTAEVSIEGLHAEIVSLNKRLDVLEELLLK